MARDWLTEERRIQMRPEAKGVLVDLKAHAWLNGSLPTDERELARLARLDVGEFKRIWPKIEHEWQLEHRPLGDRYVHLELEEERQRQLHYRELQAARRHGAPEEPDGPEQLGLFGPGYGARTTKRGAGSGERGAGSGGTSRRPAKSLRSGATAVPPTSSSSASTSDPPLPPQGEIAPTGPGPTWPDDPGPAVWARLRAAVGLERPPGPRELTDEEIAIRKAELASQAAAHGGGRES